MKEIYFINVSSGIPGSAPLRNPKITLKLV
jgi:hypothetical protein